jgi:hypothetical protein
MLTHGAEAAERAVNAGPDSVSTDGPADVTFYDGARVFYQIADYTGDRSWNRAAEAAAILYRDVMVFGRNGDVRGWRLFPYGLCEHYLRTGDERSREAALLMAARGSFAVEGTPFTVTAPETLSREVAYNLHCYLTAMKLGAPRPTRLTPFYEQALSHLDQWFVWKSWEDYAPYMVGANWIGLPDYARRAPVNDFAPFMYGLTAEALIACYEALGPDPRLVAGLQTGADWIWENAWVDDACAFWYRSNNRVIDATLNMLIVPVFAWLALRTGDMRYIDRGDRIFAGAARYGDLTGGKRFNQHYRWSFQYVAWRDEVARLPIGNRH